MGYDLHITRKENWTDDNGESITPDEWLSVLDADPELSRATDTGADTLAGAWNGQTLFRFDNGEITCKNPDEPTIRKMVAIAQRLRANVQGDDAERYPDALAPAQPTAAPAPPKPSFWRRLFGGT
jgi:hypothetical protein